MDIPADAWSEEAVPDYLRFRFVITGEDGETIAAARNLADLQQRLGKQASRQFMRSEGGEMRRDGATDWEFGSLPPDTKTSGGVVAYPALVDQARGVGLRLFENLD